MIKFDIQKTSSLDYPENDIRLHQIIYHDRSPIRTEIEILNKNDSYVKCDYLDDWLAAHGYKQTLQDVTGFSPTWIKNNIFINIKDEHIYISSLTKPDAPDYPEIIASYMLIVTYRILYSEISNASSNSGQAS